MGWASAQPTNADPLDADPPDADTTGMQTPGCRPPPGCSPLWDADPRGMQNPPPHPLQTHPRSGQLAGGTHPTGMHTCVVRNHVSTPSLLFTLIIFNFQLFLLVMFYRSTAMHLVHLLNPMLYILTLFTLWKFNFIL